MLADKAYDADARVIEPLQPVGKMVAIPSKRIRTAPRLYDQYVYQTRHLIENFFAKLRQFRAMATRYDKTTRNFPAAIRLAATVVWLS